MSDEIPEADWKTFRELRTVALERFCERVLAELVKLATDSPGSNHERYLAVYQLIKKRDKELAGAFDDFRRSTAVRQIAIIQSRGLWTEEELARFSAETRAAAEFLMGLGGG